MPINTKRVRSFLVADLRFAIEGSSINDLDWSRRKKLLLEQLSSELPHLNQLQSSTIDVVFRTTSNATQMEVYLVESPQFNLRLSPKHDSDQDLYMQDVAKVQAQQQGLPERYEQAWKSSADPVDHPDMIERRHRLREARKTGHILINSSTSGDPFVLGDVPSFLPQGSLAISHGVVSGVTRTGIRLRLSSEMCCSSSDRLLHNLGSSLFIELTKEDAKLQSLLAFTQVMHAQVEISVEVLVEFRWRDGKPAKHTLRKWHRPET